MTSPVSAIEAAAELDQISVALRKTATGPNELSSNASNKLLRDAASSIEALARQAEALQRENAELREALRPFASIASYFGHLGDDYGSVMVNIDLGSLRRARALLGGENAE